MHYSGSARSCVGRFVDGRLRLEEGDFRRARRQLPHDSRRSEHRSDARQRLAPRDVALDTLRIGLAFFSRHCLYLFLHVVLNETARPAPEG